MNILGIQCMWHDPSACIIKNGKVVAMAEEERFIRKKHADESQPIQSIKYCLKEANLTPEDIDIVAQGWAFKNSYILPTIVHGFRALNGSFISRIGRSVQTAYRFHTVKKLVKKILINANFRDESLMNTKIMLIEHHMAHAASAYYPSPFQSASVLVMDGRGEIHTTTTWEGGDEKLSKIKEMTVPHSLGGFYGGVTEFLGYRFNNGEGKVMGLAAYGRKDRKVSQQFDDLIKVSEGKYKLNAHYFEYGKHKKSAWYTQKLENKLGVKPLRSHKNINQIYKNIAYYTQQKLEQAALELAENLIKETGIRKLCIGGGVGLNCTMNKRLLESDLVDDIWIQPVANDAGIALGAALSAYVEITGERPDFTMEHTYYGSSYSDEEVKSIFEESKISYERENDVSKVAAELLVENKLVGWFQGRMECGPRALGNRSILANPAKMENKDLLNRYVKHREEWRPFAPSMLDDVKEEYLENPYPSPFMILTFDVKEEKRDKIPAIVHVDGTTRPQTVKREVNPLYWELIKKFGEMSGVPVILNTSFNDHGEPIVENPKQAIKHFYSTGMDYLIINNFLIHK